MIDELCRCLRSMSAELPELSRLLIGTPKRARFGTNYGALTLTIRGFAWRQDVLTVLADMTDQATGEDCELHCLDPDADFSDLQLRPV